LKIEKLNSYQLIIFANFLKTTELTIFTTQILKFRLIKKTIMDFGDLLGDGGFGEFDDQGGSGEGAMSNDLFMFGMNT
jgi:hypothetical protein